MDSIQTLALGIVARRKAAELLDDSLLDPPLDPWLTLERVHDLIARAIQARDEEPGP